MMSFRQFLFFLVERWTGFGKVPSSAAGEVLFSVQPNKQESTEGHHGKSLSCGSYYFYELLNQY
jgi:hypothetical protein